MLNWQWSNKLGYLVTKDDNNGYKINLYGGNALMIAVWEWKENDKDMYSLYTFFADKDHAKRCLGLAKGSDYIMDSIKEIHLYGDDDRIWELAKLWYKAIQRYKLDVKLILEYTD